MYSFSYFPFFGSHFINVDVLGGYNGTIFAYGQTSSGKTHTMEVQYIAKWFNRSTYIHTYMHKRQRYRSSRLAVHLFSSSLLHFTCYLPLQAFCKNKPLLWASLGNSLVSFLVFLYLRRLSYFPFYLFLLIGEPSRFPRDGNHTPDLRGYLWAHICHGWEPRVSHKGWSAFPHWSVVVGAEWTFIRFK